MPQMRLATADDVLLICSHRASMFAENQFAPKETLDAMSVAFEPWLRERLLDGRYVGLLMEENGECLAGAGIFYADFPPHFLHLTPVRPYLLNFYTEPGARGRGLAKVLLQAAVDHCRARGHEAIVLHASPFGRPVYQKFGFVDSNEMMLLPS